MEEQFDSIIQEALRKASSVGCSVEDYQAGLRSMMESIRDELQASTESSE